MKQAYAQKHPYLFVILMGLLCTFITALGTAVPQIIGLELDAQLIVTTIFLLASVGMGIFLMRKSRYTLAEYGFRRSTKNIIPQVWWYAPLLLIEILPIAIVGFSAEITVKQYIILFFFTLAVGFNEEIYFRGLALKNMEEKGIRKAIIWSSAVFGVLHLINALNGKNTLYLVLQVIFAFLVGFVLAEIVSITKSLWIVILWHAAHDYISSITGDALDTKALIILAIQVAILLIYGAYLWKKSKHNVQFS